MGIENRYNSPTLVLHHIRGEKVCVKPDPHICM